MRKLKVLFSVLLVVCTLLGLCSCASENVDAAYDRGGSVLLATDDSVFEVAVTDKDGNPIADVELHLSTGSGKFLSETTNEKGVAVFDAEVKKGDSVVVASYPDGYECKTTEFEIEESGSFVIEMKKLSFDLFNVLALLGGLALFLYGMTVMGNALEKRAGNKLKILLETLTSNTFKGFLLGLIVTLVIQSSSATTVMVVGFVNSGLMSLKQSIGVIMGANIGTTVTAWILSLGGIESNSFFVQLFKPMSFTPILALIGIAFYMFSKTNKKKDTGTILLGFAVLMFGMDIMSGAVAGLKNVPAFQNLFVMFKNPILGVLAGAVLTAIIFTHLINCPP